MLAFHTHLLTPLDLRVCGDPRGHNTWLWGQEVHPDHMGKHIIQRGRKLKMLENKPTAWERESLVSLLITPSSGIKCTNRTIFSRHIYLKPVDALYVSSKFHVYGCG